ncbi:Stk1 family PASTA domain-containing Ser/Thr kinase [uncultured Faecalicoccus sp.]|uniref:Stk1 family PASTA domain-containing Ser/Thr kinase n=1 Tax=uncultured Faecalicoccus sp. TaxID=1971760 RepID=UPI0025D0DEAB|nr:Stk1 family PASTA domain-containing Ser/Thr kinase [uncultured Faecalicoccus sp.]
MAMIKEIANRYQILSLIGQGGMADVYRAKDKILDRVVAIKVLRSKLSEDPMVLVRFQREASAASRLSHPNVVDIYDVGEYEGMHYIVMEYVRGRTLKQLIMQRGALNFTEALDIMKQLVGAVIAAHQKNIIHRDIKPQNVLIKDDGTIKITDFGIAVASDSVQLTLNNAVMGSAHYLAPETAQGKEPTEQVDIYSLGIVFYELLTGTVPFKGQTPTEIAIQHLRVSMPYVRDFNPSIPQSVENIILKATAKDPLERYAHASDMLYDLEHCRDRDQRGVGRLQLKNPSTQESQTGPSKSKTGKEDKERKHSSKTFGVLAGICVALIVCLSAFFVLSLSGTISLGGLFGQYTIPDVVEMSEEEAKETLVEAGFTQDQIKVEKEASDSVEVDHVISVSPEEGQKASQEDSIILTICKGPTYLIQDYTGQYLSDIEAQFKEEGLHIQIKVEEKAMANTNPGYILEQKGLKVGDRIDPDEETTITFVVAAYPSIEITADLIGRNYDEVYEELNAMGIAVARSGSGSTIVDVSPSIGTTYVQEGSDSYITLYTE